MPMRLDDGWNQVNLLIPFFSVTSSPLLTFHHHQRFNSTSLTLPAAPTAQTTSKPYASKSTQTAVSAGSTFRIGCIPRRSCPQSSSCFCRFRSRLEGLVWVGGMGRDWGVERWGSIVIMIILLMLRAVRNSFGRETFGRDR